MPDLRRPSQWWKAPPPGDVLLPPQQRATPARKGARCGAGAGSARPHRPHPGHTGRGILAAQSRGRAAGGRTAPDTRRPSQRWQATPPGTAPHHPRGTQPPQGMQARGTVLGPDTHTPAPTALGLRTPTARPVGGQSGEGQRLTSDAPHIGGRHPLPGDALPLPPQRATPACKGASCGAGAGSPRPHRPHPGHTGRGTLAARSRGRAAGGGTAPDTRRPSQRWQATPPRGRPPTTTAARSPHRARRPRGQCWAPTPTHPRPQQRGWRTPTARPVGRQSGEGQRLTSDAPHNGGRHPPGERPSATPTASNAGPQGRTLWDRCWVTTPAPTAPRTHGSRNPGCPLQRTGGGGGTAPDTRHPSQRWQATPPGDGPPRPPRHAAPTGHAGQGDSVGPPQPHTRAHSTWVADPNSPPSGRAVGGGTAPDLRRP